MHWCIYFIFFKENYNLFPCRMLSVYNPQDNVFEGYYYVMYILGSQPVKGFSLYGQGATLERRHRHLSVRRC